MEEQSFDAIGLGVFASRIAAACDEMGAVLQRSALSPNIKERLDFSCAVFDAAGLLCAQAAHIPVHLGSMAYAMGDIVGRMRFEPGDVIVMNDPFLGGTHLPDVTVISPLFVADVLTGFVANRAHHARIGAATPGSMPVSRCLDEEGVVIPPVKLYAAGRLEPEAAALLGRIEADAEVAGIGGDFAAQVSANGVGLRRLAQLIEEIGADRYQRGLAALNDYAERLARAEYAKIPDGCYRFTDFMDDDGCGATDIPIAVAVIVDGSDVDVDFAGTAAQVKGNVNCPLAVAAAAVYYVFRCLLSEQAPASAGLFAPIAVRARRGSLVNAEPPAAVAAGNVETSSRIVDAVLGALAPALSERIPAASQGSMNNIAMGARGERDWDYYETVGGGMGASARGDGLSGVQTHMTNTLNTPIESLEMHYPLRVGHYGLRHGSGGDGIHRGGDGIVRELEFLAPATVTLLTERRRRRPWGLAGGDAGRSGANLLNGSELPPKCTFRVDVGDRLRVETAGGGGWGQPPPSAKSD